MAPCGGGITRNDGNNDGKQHENTLLGLTLIANLILLACFDVQVWVPFLRTAQLTSTRITSAGDPHSSTHSSLLQGLKRVTIHLAQQSSWECHELMKLVQCLARRSGSSSCTSLPKHIRFRRNHSGLGMLGRSCRGPLYCQSPHPSTLQSGDEGPGYCLCCRWRQSGLQQPQFGRWQPQLR